MIRKILGITTSTTIELIKNTKQSYTTNKQLFELAIILTDKETNNKYKLQKFNELININNIINDNKTNIT